MGIERKEEIGLFTWTPRNASVSTRILTNLIEKLSRPHNEFSFREIHEVRDIMEAVINFLDGRGPPYHHAIRLFSYIDLVSDDEVIEESE